MRVLYWGTYDEGKPRNRIMLRGLRENGVHVDEYHRNIWKGIEDKSQISKFHVKIMIVFSWLLSYPRLVLQYLRAPRHDCVVVGYLGHLDVLVLWPFAKLRKTPVVWDAFLSLYDTVVNDRKLFSKSHPAARMLHYFEKLACGAADLVVLDTEAHATYFIEEYGISRDRCVEVLVGAEIEKFPIVNAKAHDREISRRKPMSILFYGQFIPLHGIETILGAAHLLKDKAVFEWTLIGSGQEAEKIEKLLTDNPLPQLNWLKWVQYQELKNYILKADLCLGIFGSSGKASRVIPNKVFQIISCGKTLITRDSAAMRELADENNSGIFLIPPDDPQALADVLVSLHENPEILQHEPHFTELRSKISPQGIGRTFVDHLQMLANQAARD